ncbi:acylphosphatase [Salidesulfovibrio onnuriiensis]|uniref:acylphosphatase n=1 Tax=Salidesulfovibrio onnuriiensis TaxID=2583823 RepID=UPI0011C7B710|nr:acylphosphatase [Salidesulfovibrio onnuriiensis]
MKQLHAIVKGKVQGVWFRAWTLDVARDLGLKGWVRNMPEGHVETLAQGDQETLDRFLESLRDGPPLARVVEIDTNWGSVEENFTNFSVKY